MAQQQYIKHLYEVEEKSLNEIAKMTGFNYHTIQKYAYRENWSVEHLPNYAHIEFFHDHRQIGSYRRSYGSGEEIYDWTQYVTTLRKKPDAAEHTRFFLQLPALWQQHLRQTSGKERKNTLYLLEEMVTDGNSCFCDGVLELSHENGRTDVDSIR